MKRRIKLSAAVMAHESRRPWVEELLAQTGIGEERVAWDTDSNRWHTGRAAWMLFDPACTHHLVIQDDVLPCRDLLRGVGVALKYVPAQAIVSLFYGRPRELPSPAEVRWSPGRVTVAEAAIKAHASWVVLPALTWGPAIILPTSVITAMVAWADKQDRPGYDVRVGQYAKVVLNWHAWHPWPSLVEHRGVESLCGRHGFTSAYRFLGEDVSALATDWSGPVVGRR